MPEHTTLAPYTTFRVGGEPRELITARSRIELVAAVTAIWANDEDPLVLGGGSNVLISDDGYDGTAIIVATRGIERLADSPAGRVRLRVEAGEPWDAVVAAAVENGWSGIEALSGIPGSAGAAPVQNIGAYGQELSAALVAIDFLDRETLEVERVDASALELGYRTSVLKRHGGQAPQRDGVVVAIELELGDSGGLGEPVAYDQLSSALGVELGERMPIAQVRETVIALRASKGMVLDPADPDTASAGSFFTNPIVTAAFASTLPSDAPRWPLDDDDDDVIVIPLGEWDGVLPLPAATDPPALVKLSAAWLIEHSDIPRGFRLPGSRAAISSKHTLALTNQGGSTAAEIASLARFVRSRVQAEFGVVLAAEPVVVDVEL